MLRLSAVLLLAAAATVGVGWTPLGPTGSAATDGRPGARPAACGLSIRVGGVPTDVEATSDAVWVATALGGLVRIDPSTNRPVARIRPGGAVTSLTRGFGAVWAIDLFGERLLRVDPRSNRVVSSTRVDSLPSAVAVGHGLVWVASQLRSTVAGIDPSTGDVVKLARFARGELWPGGLAVGPYGVWVITAAGNEVSVFDPETMTFRDRVRVPGARTLVADGDGAWVGVAGKSELVRIHDGRVVRVRSGVRADGYGPSLALERRLWVAERNQVVALGRSSGGVVHRTRLSRGTDAGPIAARGQLWAVDGGRGALVRLGDCRRKEATR